MPKKLGKLLQNKLNANHKKIATLRSKQDKQNMEKLLGSWDELVIDELKINNQNRR